MRISVIIPSYNRAGLVSKTLESVLAQTRPPDEILVVDDGSTDATREVVAAFGPRVRYHYQKNSGLSASRNIGLALSDGDAVLMLDSDDLLRPAALARLEAALESEPSASLAYCRSDEMDAEGAVIGPWSVEDCTGWVWEALLTHNFIRSSGAALIRRASVEQAGVWDATMRVMEDWDMWLRLSDLGPFVRVDDPLFLYRLHGGTISTNNLSMARREYELYRVHLGRHRRNPERRRLLLDAYQRCRQRIVSDLISMALEDRMRGDLSKSLEKFHYVLRLNPACLQDPGLAKFWLGTHKRLLLQRLQPRPDRTWQINK